MSATVVRRRVLIEDHVPDPGGTLCRGTVKGVRVCGLQSANGRRYLPQCLKRAVPLYDGVPVYQDHQPGNGERPVADKIGVLRRPRFVKDKGIVADLHYLRTHPLGARIGEAARCFGEAFGLSHHAECEVEELDNGGQLVTNIVKLWSVDLVAEPATAAGLFEGKRMSKRVRERLLDGAGTAVDSLARLVHAIVVNSTLDKPAKLAKIEVLLDVADGLGSEDGDADADAPGTAPAVAESRRVRAWERKQYGELGIPKGYLQNDDSLLSWMRG